MVTWRCCDTIQQHFGTCASKARLLLLLRTALACALACRPTAMVEWLSLDVASLQGAGHLQSTVQQYRVVSHLDRKGTDQMGSMSRQRIAMQRARFPGSSRQQPVAVVLCRMLHSLHREPPTHRCKCPPCLYKIQIDHQSNQWNSDLGEGRPCSCQCVQWRIEIQTFLTGCYRKHNNEMMWTPELGSNLPAKPNWSRINPSHPAELAHQLATVADTE